jgi:hypothetical protein
MCGDVRIKQARNLDTAQAKKIPSQRYFPLVLNPYPLSKQQEQNNNNKQSAKADIHKILLVCELTLLSNHVADIPICALRHI